MTLRSILQRYPPFLCLALAITRNHLPYTEKQLRLLKKLKRKNFNGVSKVQLRKWAWQYRMKGLHFDRTPAVRRMLIGEIACKMGALGCVPAGIAKELNWDHVPVALALRFMEACGLDILNMRAVERRMERYRKQHGSAFYYLTLQQLKQLARMVKKAKALNLP